MILLLSKSKLRRKRRNLLLGTAVFGLFVLSSYLLLKPLLEISHFAGLPLSMWILCCTLGLGIYRFVSSDLEVRYSLDQHAVSIERRSVLGRSSELVAFREVYKIIDRTFGKQRLIRLFCNGRASIIVTARSLEVPALIADFADAVKLRADGKKRRFACPLASLLFVSAIVLHQFTSFDSMAPSGAFDLIAAGGWVQALIQQGEYFRLLSYVLVHGSAAHLGQNVLLLLLLGMVLETHLGRLGFAALFIGTALVAGLSSFFSEFAVLVGASGGIYGLLGAYLALRTLPVFQFEDPFGAASSRLIVLGLIVESVIGLYSSQVAVLIHAFGFVFGVVGVFIFHYAKPLLLVFAIAALVTTGISRFAVGPWTDARAYELALTWLDPLSPRRLPAAWEIATSESAAPAGVIQALAALQDVAAPADLDTYATLLARLGHYQAALEIENQILDEGSPLASYVASQIVRISRAQRSEALALPPPDEFRGLFDAVCPKSPAELVFYRLPHTEWARVVDACPGPLELVALHGTRDFRTIDGLALKPGMLELPLALEAEDAAP